MLQKFFAATVVVGLFLARGGVSQTCYSQANCTGDVVEAPGLNISTVKDCCVGTNDGQSFADSNGTCIEDQCVVHGFLNVTYWVLESERVDTIFRANVKGMTSFANVPLLGTIMAISKSAESGDFQAFSTIIVQGFADDIIVQTIDDDITLEYDDIIHLVFTLGPQVANLVERLEAENEYLRAKAHVIIEDNDELQINFEELDYSINEGDSTANLITMQYRRTENDFTLRLTPVSIADSESMYDVGDFVPEIDEEARATADDDFSSAPFEVIIPAGTTTIVLPPDFEVEDDDVNEIEQFYVLIGELGADVTDRFTCFQRRDGDERGCAAGRTGATTIRIIDNDPMVIGFEIRNQTVSESQAPPGMDRFPIRINIMSERESEIDYEVPLRHVDNVGEATLEGLQPTTLEFDALFGAGDPLEETQILFAGGQRLQITTFIINDFRAEDRECFSLRVFVRDTGEGVRRNFMCNEDGAGDAFFCLHTICIIDDDDPFEVAFVEKSYTVFEDVGTVEVCVNLTEPQIDILNEEVYVMVFNDPTSVYIPPGGIRATPDPFDFFSGMYLMAPMTDYEEQTLFGSSRISNTVINATRRIICYDQPIYDDDCLEPIEYAGLGLSANPEDSVINPSSVRTVVRRLCDDSAICIVDDDEAVVGLEQTIFTVQEDVGVVELCAIVYEPSGIDCAECPIAFPFDVRLSTWNDTAVNPMDYLELNSILSFDACETRRCVNVTIVDDLVDELMEYFNFTLERTPGLDPRISLNPVDGRIAIIDNDVPITVGYEFTVYTTSEGEGMVELSVIIFDPPSGGTPRPFTLSINTEDGTAVSPDDYNGVANGILTFNLGDVRVNHTIIINQDDICENDPYEDFFSNLALDSGIQPIIVIRPSAQIIINDTLEPECNPIRVGYERSVYTTDEGQGVVELCAIIYDPPSGGAPRPFFIFASTMDGTAVSPLDYGGVSNVRLDFAIGDERVCHLVSIVDDDICEIDPNENFFSNLVFGGGEQPIIVDPSRTEVIIDDTNQPECGPITVGYEFTVYSTSESAGVVEICAIIYEPPTGGALRDFVVSSTTRDGSAIAGEDYLHQSVNLTFARGSTSQCHSVTILNDDNCELPPEDFFADLAYVSGRPIININIPTTRVIIDDSNEPECDPITVGYEFTEYFTSEGAGFVELCAVVSSHPDGSPRPFTISATTEDGGAVAGEDYTAVVDEPLVFAQGQSRECHRVLITQDDICEIDQIKDFFSNLAYVSGIMPIIIDPPRTRVIISDTNEPECADIRVGYEMTVYNTTEGDTFVELCAIIYEPISGVAPRPFVISYATSDDTAVAPEDYIADAGLLMFATGDDQQCHRVQIVDDDICERELEQFFSRLAYVSGTPVIIVDPDTARVIIIDDVPDCVGVFVNDTLTGDPLMTVPIFTDPNVRQGDPVSSICYEVHGAANTFFNLITDECTSVNAHYQEAVTPSPNIDLNVVTQIGVRTVGVSGACWNIQVNLNMCRVSINGEGIVTNTFDGISVKLYNSRRVRISVPNCDDTMLVMWVMCRNGSVEDPVTWEYFNINFIRFVVMRGLNLNERSHGLMGQFWNVPVTVVPFEGEFGGIQRDDDYVITVSHPESAPRSFVGLRSGVTWEFERRTCYYVGNNQAGELAEVSEPNDSVIEGDYSEYTVESLFATEFTYTHFNNDNC